MHCPGQILNRHSTNSVYKAAGAYGRIGAAAIGDGLQQVFGFDRQVLIDQLRRQLLGKYVQRKDSLVL